MRTGKVTRRTRETEVEVSLTLDSDGGVSVYCEEVFLKHMLETLAKYGSFNMEVRASGDDGHHLVEDVAIVLGLALRQAMGDTPVQRMGWATVPMDDALVTVSLDLIDRPYVDVDCDDPLYMHFLRSLAMSCGFTLHVVVERGFDEHHTVEATFKALGIALNQALIPRKELLSTKAKPEVGGQ